MGTAYKSANIETKSDLENLLLSKQGVDQAGLANVGMTKGANGEHLFLLILNNEDFKCDC